MKKSNRIALALIASIVFEQDAASAAPYGIANSEQLPNVSGAIDQHVNQGNIRQTICVPGYARSARPPYTLTGPLKRDMMRAQHYGQRFSLYELDHLVPLSLGGAPSSPDNLWLQPWNGPWNASDKDALEFVLWRLVCTGQLPLSTAQREIAGNWIDAYRHYATPANLARYSFRHSDGD